MLTRKDLGGTAVAALVVLAYVANAQGWWYLGSTRWAAVTMTAIAAVGCPLGARVDEARSLPFVALGLLGGATLVIAIVAIVVAAHWTLLTLAIVVVALWAGTTARHALTPPRQLAVR